jgi:hypothetical protein
MYIGTIEPCSWSTLTLATSSLGDAATATKPGLIRHLVCADGQRAEILKVFGQLLIGED